MSNIKYVENIESVFSKTEYNLNVSAVAGSGKTTLLLRLLKLVPKNSKCSFFAFNNFIVKELKERNTIEGINIMTLHSYGWHCILRRYGNKIKMNPNKAIAKTEQVLKKIGDVKDKQKSYCFYAVPKVIDLMRSNLVSNDSESISDLCDHYDIFVGDFEIDVIMKVFDLVIRDKSQFDFTDMIYQPVTDTSIRLTKYDYIFCDESQDFSAAQQSLIKGAINRKGRLITVGDERQAIYGFAGADSNSYNNLSTINGQAIKMPLSICWRCSKSVVIEAQKIVPHIKYNPNAIQGEVRYGSLLEVKHGDWVICRNLKPLVQTCLWFLKNRIKAKIRGKDIGEGLINLINKTGAKTIDKLLCSLERESDKLLNKLKDKGVKHPSKHPKMEILINKIEVIQFLCEEVVKVNELKELIDNIFSDENKGIILSTIHKSKGLENDNVFFLCPELIPSKFAIQDWQIEQEMNLKYVCITRAKDKLIYVSSNQFTDDITQEIKIK